MKMTHGVFEIKNLMGNEIGFVSFAVRLTSYGNSLLPHIERTTAESLQRQMKLKAKKTKRDNKKPQDDVPEPRPDAKGVAEDQDTPKANDSFYYIKKPTHQTQEVRASIPAASEAANAMVQTMKIDYKDVEVQISCGLDQTEKSNHEANKDLVKKVKPEPEKVEQTEIEHIVPQSVYKVTRVQEEPINDEFCPPILYYNSGEPVEKTTINTSTVQEILDKKEFLQKRIEYLKSALDKNEETNSESVSDLNSDSELGSMLEWIIPAKTSSTAAATSNFDLSQMPLLKCLFDEMNLLKDLIAKKSPTESHEIIKSKHQKNRNESIKTAGRGSVTNLSQCLVEPKKQEPIKQHRTQTLQSSQKPVGILRTNRKLLDMKKSKSGFKTKEQMVDSVNRLTSGRDRKPAIKPRSQQMEQLYECDEIPVGPFSK